MDVFGSLRSLRSVVGTEEAEKDWDSGNELSDGDNNEEAEEDEEMTDEELKERGFCMAASALAIVL